MEKKNIKVRDLKPSKDAKGGGSRTNAHGLNTAGTNTAGRNTHGLNTGSTNTKSHQHHGGSGHH